MRGHHAPQGNWCAHVGSTLPDGAVMVDLVGYTLAQARNRCDGMPLAAVFVEAGGAVAVRSIGSHSSEACSPRAYARARLQELLDAIAGPSPRAAVDDELTLLETVHGRRLSGYIKEFGTCPRS